MTNNIKNVKIELIEKKFNTGSLIAGILLIAISCLLFIYSGNFESNMASSALVFVGVVAVAFALFLLFANN